MYNGLTIADKDALLDAKAKGAEWVAREAKGMICGFNSSPIVNSFGEWNGDHKFTIGYWSALKFVRWGEPVHIPTALAQIAEMEREQKPDGCEHCIDGVEFGGGMRIVKEDYERDDGTPYPKYFITNGNSEYSYESDYISACPMCGKRLKAEDGK